MAAIKGKKVMLFLTGSATGDGVVPLSTGLSFSYNVSMIDPETKDDGEFQVPDPDGDTWEITNNAQGDVDLDTAKALVTDYNALTRVKLTIAEVGNYDKEGLDHVSGGAWIFNSAKAHVEGYGIISNLTITGAVGSRATVDATWTGNSDVTISDPT
jgi:hypothetical protein